MTASSATASGLVQSVVPAAASPSLVSKVSFLTATNTGLIAWVIVVTLALVILAAVSFRRWRKDYCKEGTSTFSDTSSSINDSELGGFGVGETNRSYLDDDDSLPESIDEISGNDVTVSDVNASGQNATIAIEGGVGNGEFTRL